MPRGSDATFWIEKFMKTASHEKDPELIGHNNDMTPLAVVAAARWRKTLDDVQREQALQREAEALAERSRLKEEKARSEGLPFFCSYDGCPCSCTVRLCFTYYEFQRLEDML